MAKKWLITQEGSFMGCRHIFHVTKPTNYTGCKHPTRWSYDGKTDVPKCDYDLCPLQKRIVETKECPECWADDFYDGYCHNCTDDPDEYILTEDEDHD